MMASSATRKHLDPAKEYLSHCTSLKIGYATRSQAFDAAELLMQEGRVNPGCHITPYECRDCGQWHVFNRPIVNATSWSAH